MKKLNTIEMSDIVIKNRKDEIHNVWNATENKRSAFNKFKKIVKGEMEKLYGKKNMSEFSGQYIGYTAHYIYVYCNNL